MLSSDTMNKLQIVLADLRAQHWLYYTLHWQAANYQLHLLFQRLYESLPDQFDGLAEKLVAAAGKQSVDASTTMRMSQTVIDVWATGADPLDAALASERDLEAAVFTALASLTDPGLENFLQGVADDHQTNVYLLRQSQGA